MFALTPLLGAVLGLSASEPSPGEVGRLDQIRERGVLRCGVDTGLPGFAQEGEDGWQGFEIDLCHAYAAAFLGDETRVSFVPLTTAERLDAVEAGQVDILLRNTSWTASRQIERDVAFAGVYYFDGQGFLVPADLGITSARELDGARVCVLPETTSALNLADYIETYRLEIQIVEIPTATAGLASYSEGECDALSSDVSMLAGLRVGLDDPDAHAILPDIISKEPLGPVVHSADREFVEAVRWVLYGLIAAEEFGVTADRASELAQTSANAHIQRLLGAQGGIGEALGLDGEFVLNAIEARGHYGEIFERHLGQGGTLGLSRGLNDQWTRGGLLYAPPFR